MNDIKYDFDSCYDAYSFEEFDYEEVIIECEPNEFHEAVEDILKALLIQCEIEPSLNLLGFQTL